ncbi:MAG: hypothetical protein SH850_23075 [Planctomycetaceae bacterium]|nr:hypothetical protein [Planctomycetaceae bacterium]
MIRGCVEPGLLILVCCHGGAWLAQGVSNAAHNATAHIRPCDHVCAHCGYPNPVEIEDVVYRCDVCQGRNNRLGELMAIWQEAPGSNPHPTESPAPVSPEMSITGL